MTLLTMLPQTGTAGTVGTAQIIGTNTTVINLQFNPQLNVGFTGSLVVEGSNVATPGANDWILLVTGIFTAQTSNVSINMNTSITWLRVRLPSGSTSGAISAYASF